MRKKRYSNRLCKNRYNSSLRKSKYNGGYNNSLENCKKKTAKIKLWLGKSIKDNKREKNQI